MARRRRTRRNASDADKTQIGRAWGTNLMRALKAAGRGVPRNQGTISNIILEKANAVIPFSDVAVPGRPADPEEARAQFVALFRETGWAGPTRLGVQEVYQKAKKKPWKVTKTTTTTSSRPSRVQDSAVDALFASLGEGAPSPKKTKKKDKKKKKKKKKEEAPPIVETRAEEEAVAGALLSGQMTLEELCDHLDTLPNPSRRYNTRRRRSNLRKKAVPKHLARTPRAAATNLYVYPRSKSFPIGDLYHARLALVPYLMSPSLAPKRKKVLSAVASAYPEYNWKAYWNAAVRKHNRKRGAEQIGTWDEIVGGATSRKRAANPRRRKRNTKHYKSGGEQEWHATRGERRAEELETVDELWAEVEKRQGKKKRPATGRRVVVRRGGKTELTAAQKRHKKQVAAAKRQKGGTKTSALAKLGIANPRRRRLNPYQKFMGKEMRKGKSMKQAAALWRRRR